MIAFHNFLDVAQGPPAVDIEVIKNLLLAMPSAEVFRSLRRPDVGWQIWGRHGWFMDKIEDESSGDDSENVQVDSRINE